MDELKEYVDELFAEYDDEKRLKDIKKQAYKDIQNLYEKEEDKAAAIENAKKKFGMDEYIKYTYLYGTMSKEYNEFLSSYKRKVKTGILCIFIIPIMFLCLMFTQQSKLVFLTLWICSILIIAGYLIYLEYIKIFWEKRMKRLGGQ